MNVPRALLDILQCGVCETQLSRGPVYLQRDGVSLCGLCFTPESHATRNVLYETLAQFATFPCKYKTQGCEESVPFTQEGAEIPHEDTCEHRVWGCCAWQGPRAGLLKHYEDQHLELVLYNPCIIGHDITRSSEKIYLLQGFNVLFLLHVEVNVTTGKLIYIMRYVGPSEEAIKFCFILNIKRRNGQLLRETPQSCLAIKEATPLVLDINSFLNMQGFEGATFTVEVQWRECSHCGVQAKELLLYRDARSWKCEGCAPIRRACQNQNCSYIDIKRKCFTHERIFCEQLTQCKLCKSNINQGTMSAHRSSGCLEVHGAGSTWRPAPGWKWSLVSGDGGIAVLWCHLHDEGFDFTMDIPVLSERLREFGCVVRVTQPATGLVRTYTPDAQYDEGRDWNIIVKKTEFPAWDAVFDVTVDVTKIL